MNGFRRLVGEIHRRSLWQVLGIYLAGSWIVFEVVEALTDTVGLPAWVPTFAIVLLLIGLPIVMATAFVQEGGPRGTEAAGRPSSRPTGLGDPSTIPGTEDSDAVGPSPVSAAPASLAFTERAVSHRLFTWRNAVLGGVGAFALLGVATAGYMALRALGIGPAGTLVAKGLLEERATIIVADFASADSSLARAATEALRVDLSQSPVVRLAEPSVVRDGLARMERETDEALDLELARQLGQREGIPAVIGGEINPAGGGFVLTARLVGVEDGAILASQRSTAEDESELVAAIDRLSNGIRERIGESMRSIRASPPLAQVTTPHLGALRKYSQALRVIHVEGPSPRALALLQDAVELDTAFAMAWRQLGTELWNRREERERGVDAIRKAFEHQDRLTERERHVTRAAYFLNVTYELERAILEYERLLEFDPADHHALNNLGVAYAQLRDFERAAEYFERAARAEPESFRPLSNLIEVEADLGRFDRAQARLDSAAARFSETVPVVWFQSHLAATRGDHERALERSLHLWREEAVRSLDVKSIVGSDLGSLAGALGRLGEAHAFLSETMAANEERGLGGQYLANAIQAAWLDLLVRGDRARAVSRVTRALERFPLSGVSPLDRPRLGLAELFAVAGDPGRARRHVAAFEEEVPAELREAARAEYHRALGEIALAEGRPEEAIAEFRRSDTGYCVLCPLPGLARAHAAVGDVDAAIAAHERYVETHWFYRFFGNDYARGPQLGPSLERLGQLYDGRDSKRAAEHYARFVELWAEADEELQPRVRAAQARLEQIVAERG